MSPAITTEQEKLQNILINENAYIFCNSENINISRSKIEQVFRDVSTGKSSNFLLKQVKQIVTINNEQVLYSICVFKYISQPTFLEESVDNWIETKLAYLLIVEIDDYIIISRKNISKIQDFIKLFDPIDYKILSTLFIKDETQFEKFHLKNLNVSNKAVREKSIEAINLKENFSALGANNYMLNSLRLKNANEKVSLILNSSRVNKFGRKNSIEEFCHWAEKLVTQIKHHTEKETFLSIFAEPQDYESHKDTLVPISILFTFSELYTDFENGVIANCVIRFLDEDLVLEKNIDIIKYLENFERLSKVVYDEDNEVFKVENTIVNDIELRFNEKSITLRSSKLKHIVLIKDNGTEVSIIDYISVASSFIINFDNIDLAYTNRKLFKDSKLLGNIDHFMKIFVAHENLSLCVSEKGRLTSLQTQFDDLSVFNFVEQEFLNDAEYFICDDLEKEWADHIAIFESKIIFYHSKHDNAQFSASAFQEIVGQAQKNLGNLSPQNYQLIEKRNFWNSTYNNDGVRSSISRIRKGNNIDDIINQYQSAINNPHYKGEVHLVIDFISKNLLEENLNKLKNGDAFARRSEAIQILWFISSLISSCQEANTDVYVHCKR
ncbi:hypothetical protein [Cytophaga aurantiaca]|uniref:hypothetical protein n=1 Tax=Cytophaga aurantiaca TaxID=29530 RepID=UPI0003779B17|nr:hypothetical protein [Cytophaga aurantiaca]